jgi:CRISPR-associated protein (TIGR03986 family)
MYHADRFTGWIDVDLVTLSPLYIRGGLSPKDYEAMERQEKDPNDKTPHLDKVRNRPVFFHTGDPNTPVIPGSSLRGMLRSMCEIIGHGKLAPVSDQALPYRAVGDTSSHGDAYRNELMEEVPGKKNWFIPKFEAGYIREEPDGWFIEPAENLIIGDPSTPTYARIPKRKIPSGLPRWYSCKNAFEIFVECDRYEFKKIREGFIHIKRASVTAASSSPGGSMRRAVLARTGDVPKKATEAVIFAPSGVPKEQWIRIPDGTDLEDRRDLVTAYLDQVTKNGRFNQKEQLGSDQGVLRNYQPVMYVMEGGKLRFFGHTQMFRMPYRRSPETLLSAAHVDDGKVDLAEAMFGSARSREAGAAGRVFVSDAQLVPEQDRNLLWLAEDPVVIPRILSGPKPTTFQHYLVQTNPDVEKGKGLLTYNDAGKTTLRGHKLYWHQNNVPRSTFAEQAMDDQTKRKDTQHTQMKPVRDGVCFRFRVRFENLLSQELGLLMWSLKLGQSEIPDQPSYAHKLGMGKPLGLGSVWLKPKLRLIDFAEPRRYQIFLTANATALEQGLVSAYDTTLVEEAAVREFEQLVARALKVTTDTPLSGIPRMSHFLAMLSWPGPPRSDVKYMSIGLDETTGKITGKNEFRGRPVLPDPLDVANGG